MAATKKPKLKLLKIVIQPVFVDVAADELAEYPIEPITVPAAEWQTFVDRGLTDAESVVEQHIAAQTEPTS
jgi:hypothetical protein